MPKLKTESSESKTEADLKPGSNALAALYGFVERLERLNEEKAGIAADIKEVAGEAKSMGFDVATIRKVIQRRKADSVTVMESDALLELYESVIAKEEKARFNQSVKDGE